MGSLPRPRRRHRRDLLRRTGHAPGLLDDERPSSLPPIHRLTDGCAPRLQFLHLLSETWIELLAHRHASAPDDHPLTARLHNHINDTPTVRRRPRDCILDFTTIVIRDDGMTVGVQGDRRRSRQVPIGDRQRPFRTVSGMKSRGPARAEKTSSGKLSLLNSVRLRGQDQPRSVHGKLWTYDGLELFPVAHVSHETRLEGAPTSTSCDPTKTGTSRRPMEGRDLHG